MKQAGIVLGASGAIGNACAKALVADGYEVYGVSRRATLHPEYSEVLADLTRPDGHDIMGSLILRTRPIFLVFCVGVNHADDITNVDPVTVAQIISSNALSILHPLKTLSQIKDGKKRSVVLISSVHGAGKSDRLSYSMSKAALECVMHSTYRSLMKEQVRINCIRPGPVESAMLDHRFPVGSRIRSEYLGRIPAARFAEMSDIVEMIRYLVSDRSTYITGQTVTISGGYQSASLE